MSRTIWIIIGVVAAAVIAWFIVDLAFSLLWFGLKLGIVALVALVVFLVLRGIFSRSDGS